MLSRRLLAIAPLLGAGLTLALGGCAGPGEGSAGGGGGAGGAGGASASGGGATGGGSAGGGSAGGGSAGGGSAGGGSAGGGSAGGGSAGGGSAGGGSAGGGSSGGGSSGGGSAGGGSAGGGSGGGSADAGRPDSGIADAGVDPTTLKNKLLFGYQGWFACPGDGSAVNRWVHWKRGDGTPTVDLWPDVRELPPGERCATGWTQPDGGASEVYSASRSATVDRHFAWMQQYGIDGVVLQRFSSELKDPAFLAFRNQVLQHVRASAEAHGRVFAVMYDISGASSTTLVQDLESDWATLVNTLQVTQSPNYLRHRGKPLLAIWGLGFSDRPATTAQAQALIAWFKSQAPVAERATLLGGVPRTWRTDATWAPTLRTLDVISPWTVGAFVDDPGADNYKPTMVADLANAADAGAEYMPVVFPGFSWKNLNNGPLNQIPRRGGKFWWRQLYNAKSAGAPFVYGAMFDEVDEGTAMFKLVPTAAGLPTQYPFLPLDADGEALPSDWYLRLAGEGARMLRGEIPLSPTRPITP